MQTITCYTYGIAKANPGLAAIGVSIHDSAGAVLHEVGHTIGNGTTDYAAYQAVMTGLTALVQIFGDATKTIECTIVLSHDDVEAQLAHRHVVQNPGLIPLFMAIHNMRVEHFPYLAYTVVSPAENTIAKNLATAALDK